MRDDGTYDLVDDVGVLDLTEVMVLPGERVSFVEDPQAWARALPRNLASPYTYAVITTETNL